jgi:signal transduction histidine kinase
VWEEDGALRFEVVDDGVGFADRHLVRGAGLTNMGDRLGALGGSLVVDSAPGTGTRVRGEVPIRASDERLQA